MKKFITIMVISLIYQLSYGQEDNYPNNLQVSGIIKNITIHQGNGTVLKNSDLLFEKGLIKKIGTNLSADGKQVFDGKNKHLYPGFILASSDLGLREIANGVRGSNDFQELGKNNADVQSYVGYNAESRFINVLRSNGILLTQINLDGSGIAGQSSVVQLDAWNFNDALVKKNMGLHIYLPSFIPRGRWGALNSSTVLTKELLNKNEEEIKNMIQFFTDAKAYFQEKKHQTINLKFEGIKGLFDKTMILFVHANEVRQLLYALDFAKLLDTKIVIVGGAESYLVSNLLAKNNIGVIYDNPHSLPPILDDDIDQSYKTPYQLLKAGVEVAINDNEVNNRYRNLPFLAGTAKAYGLNSEEALSMITYLPAKLLGIDKEFGTIEEGKSATFILSEGDALDMKSNKIIEAFIQGRKIDLRNTQTELYKKYLFKHNSIKK